MELSNTPSSKDYFAWNNEHNGKCIDCLYKSALWLYLTASALGSTPIPHTANEFSLRKVEGLI